eukprot:TRINITY_DN5453_c0_g1_i1.p1 TRINITY_DN5453_c0_g1~~TRINITY_DN5453_c0_g1_i1.p1  ORF type:complete len:347 (-),score=132.59 TRINITY_DN5453_c0_g1_i1:120-1160(-)
MTKHKVAIVGSGNWGSAIATVIGENVLLKPHLFEDSEIRMYVFDELIDGRPLTEIINQEHENVKYLPGVKLPTNIVAIPDPVEAIRDATVLVFCLPHQFVRNILHKIQSFVRPDAIAVSLIKGFEVKDGEMYLMSTIIEESLKIQCCVLMGANVANDIANKQFAETTIGYRTREAGDILFHLFDTLQFKVRLIEDVEGVEICGGLKNVVALAAGFCDGLDLGTNTKAAIIRIGMSEMLKFCQLFYPTVSALTMLESCGVGDLFTTCMGGRNRKCAEAFVRTGKSWDEIERTILKGQKLQGTLTAKEVFEVLEKKNKTDDYPLFVKTYNIAFRSLDPLSLVSWQARL